MQDSTQEEPSTPVSDLIIGMFDDTSDTDVDMDRDQITPAISKSSAKILAPMDNLLKLQQERHQDTTPIKRWEILIDSLYCAHNFVVWYSQSGLLHWMRLRAL